MGSIEKRSQRPQHPWRARYRGPDGRERSRSFSRKIDAERFLATVEVDKARGEWTDPRLGQQTFGVWCLRWEAGRLHVGQATRERDASILRNHVLPEFGNVPLAAIQAAQIRSWVAELVAGGYAPTTVRKAYQLLSGALAAAVDDGLIPRTPARGVKLPPQRKPEKRFLDEDEVAALAGATEPRYRVLVLFGAYTGARLGEMARLRTDHLDLLRRLARIPGTKSRASRRTVSLPEFLVEELADHLATFGTGRDGLVFPSPDGQALRQTNFRRRIWKPAVDASVGEPMTPHDLRHTHAALLIAEGVHPKVIQERLGHASIKVTFDTYGHLMEGLDQAAARALDELGRRSLAAQPRPSGPGDVIQLSPRKAKSPSQA